MRYRLGPDGVPHRGSDERARRVHGPGAAAGGVPGTDGSGGAHLAPADDDERVIDIDYCTERPRHPPPRADRRHRHPRVGRRTASSRRPRCCSAASPRARSPRSRRTCRCCARSWRGCSSTAGAAAIRTRTARRARSSITSRAASCSTRTPRRSSTTHRPDGLHVGRRRDRRHDASGPGYHGGARSPSPTCAIRTRPKRISSGSSAEAFGPIAFNTWADMGAIALLRLLLRQRDARAPDRRGAGARDHRRASSRRGRIGSAVVLDQAFGPTRRPPPVPPLHPHRDAQRPVSRVDQPRRGARGSPAVRDSSRRSSKPASCRDTADIGDAEDLLADGRSA